MSAETSAINYRWLKIAHQDLDFWGIAGPLPWPAEEQRKIEPRGPFPFVILLEGIKRLRAAGRQWKPEWEAVEKFLLAGNELGDAIERGDFETTLRILGELELLRPGTAYCPSNRAFVFKSQGRLDAALAEAVKATERAPRVENQWMLRGHLHEQLGQEKDAVFCYRKALGLLPNHQNALEGLSRLGAMVKVTMHHPDGRHAVRFATPPDFRQEVAENVVKMPPNDSQLRSLLRQFRDLRNAECALLVLDRMLEGEPEDALLLRAWRADSLRLLKRREQAMRELEAILREAPLDAEALYVKAWCYFDANENGSGWHFIEQTLCSDPNHLHAIQDLFRHGSRVKDPTLAEEVADWAKEHRSWRGYWLASAQCSTLDANASALRYAQAAYELAPQERDALFLYANCLNDLEEGEHTAALIHPRLSAAKGDYELKYVFAGAMKKLGLPQEAIRILREALAEESEITVEWRKNCQHFLDELMGLLAVGDVEVEVHPNSDALRRSVWAGDDQGPKTELISGGVGLPAGRAVQMTPAPGYTGSTGSVGLFLHAHHTELEPVSLGFFRAHEIDFTSTEKPVMLVEATSRAKLEATARQGERRLPVTWSLYRVPSMETEGKPDDAGP